MNHPSYLRWEHNHIRSVQQAGFGLTMSGWSQGIWLCLPWIGIGFAFRMNPVMAIWDTLYNRPYFFGSYIVIERYAFGHRWTTYLRRRLEELRGKP